MPIWNSKKIKDKLPPLPRHRTEILLSYDEYIDSWAELVQGVYQEAVEGEQLAAACAAGGEEAQKLSYVVLVCLICQATRAWRTKPRLSDKLKARVDQDIARASLELVFGEEEALVGELLALYGAYADTFSEMFASGKKESEQDVLKRCAVMARYCVDKGLGKAAGRDELVQELAIAFTRAVSVFLQFTAASVADGNTLLFKHPRFIVRQDWM